MSVCERVERVTESQSVCVCVSDIVRDGEMELIRNAVEDSRALTSTSIMVLFPHTILTQRTLTHTHTHTHSITITITITIALLVLSLNRLIGK